MFIQLHVIWIFMLFMKHQDVHDDWFMWTSASYVWMNLGFCRKTCLRICRAATVTKKCPHFWNARISTELQPVQNLRIFSNNLMMFKIDLRKLQTHWPIWSSKLAHHRSRFKAAWSGNRHKRSKFLNFFAHSATALFRRDSHWIWYDSCVWTRSERWFIRWWFSATEALSLIHISEPTRRM